MGDWADNRTSTDGLSTLLATATTTKTGSVCSADVNGSVISIQCARDLTVAVGDVLIVVRVGAQWFAIGRAFTAAPADPGNDAVAASVITYGTSSFAPVETRSYRNSAWRTDNTDVYQGQYGGAGNHTGVAFFGSAPRSLAGATVTSAYMQVKRKNAGGTAAPQSSTMRLVTQSTKPAGAPTLTSSAAGPTLGWGSSTNMSISTVWAQALVDGTSGGIGFYVSGGSPYVIFEGKGSWSPAFTITIVWSR